MNPNVAIFGSKGVGKTSFILRLLTDKFYTEYNPTIFTSYNCLTFQSNHGEIKLEIVEYPYNNGTLTEYYAVDIKLQHQNLLIGLYDVNNINSYHILLEMLSLFDNSGLPIIIIGTKKDLINTNDINLENAFKFNCNIHETLRKCEIEAFHYIISNNDFSENTNKQLEEIFNKILELTVGIKNIVIL